MSMPAANSRISNLEAALLALLAMQHPKAVDAIDAFATLRRIKYIPAVSLSEAMIMLIAAMTHMEELGYARSFSDGGEEWYALTNSGAELIADDTDIKAAIGLYALMAHCGGKPC